MRFNFLIFIGCFLLPAWGSGQVSKKIVVEHFTNTKCATCAARNPGFYTNYNTQNTGGFIHLAIHPSAPYSSCILSQHNILANDERTKYYQVYGSTPKLVINGTEVNGSFNTHSIFAPYIGQTSPIQIRLDQQRMGVDSIRAQVIIKTVAPHSLPTQNLYLVLAEDTIFYNAPNGEQEHYDVLRHSYFGNTGFILDVPTLVGDSLVFVVTVATRSEWDLSRMFVLAILQNSGDKVVTQSAALLPTDGSNIIVTQVEKGPHPTYAIYPNPTNNLLRIESSFVGLTQFKILSLSGGEISVGSFTNEKTLSISNLPNGIYILILLNGTHTFHQKFVKNSK